MAKIAHDAGVPLIIDNTLATPYLIRPIEWGADIVLHSATKFLGGHGNSMAGVIVDGGKFDWGKSGKFPTLSEPNASYHGMRMWETFGDMAFAVATRVLALRDLGPSLSPMNAFLVLTGTETLPLRMQKHCDNALAVARWLKANPKVAWVNYAGLEDNESYALHKQYCPKGAGSVFTFGLKGGYEAGLKLVNSVKLFSHLANIGDTRSLIIHPASTTHRQLSDEDRAKAGAGNDVVRLSIGIEDVADIIADLEQAYGGLTGRVPQFVGMPDGGAEQRRRRHLMQRRQPFRRLQHQSVNAQADLKGSDACHQLGAFLGIAVELDAARENPDRETRHDIGADAMIELRQAGIFEEVDPPGLVEEGVSGKTRPSMSGQVL